MKTKTPPWEKAAPAKAKHRSMNAGPKATAKARAKRGPALPESG